MTPTIRVDFAGAGGTMQGIRQAGFTGRLVGIEFDGNARDTARMAGHEVFRADVRDVRYDEFGPLLGYSAGPPCQTFSAAGNGAGRKILGLLIKATHYVAQGASPIDAVRIANTLDPDQPLDQRSVLALHPLAIIRDARPQFVMLEQVRSVLPLWEAYADLLRGWGYLVDTHIWHSEQYGVAQTRQRASLVAVRQDALSPFASFLIEEGDLIAPPTHSRYYPRNPTRLDEGVLPWVSMAEALGRGMTARPSMTVMGGGTATGGAEPFGNGARQGMQREMDEGRWAMRSNYGTNGDARNRGIRTEDQPAPTVTSKINRNHWVGWKDLGFLTEGETIVMGDVRSSRGTVRNLDEPAPTLTGAMDNGNYRWQPVVEVEGDTEWVHNRPSPTIVGSFRPDVVAAPGYRRAGDPPRQRTPGSVRVTVEEAAVLQSFPADYPWQGNLGQKHQQVGNAEPPLVAQAMSSHLLNLIGVRP